MAGTTGPGGPGPGGIEPIPPLLDALLRSPGPSGSEDGPAEVWRAALADCADTSRDRLGSALAHRPGTGEGPSVAIFTHIDEIGLIVRAISEEGFLLIGQIGGWDPQNLVGQRVEVLGRHGPVPGVIGRRAIHLLTREQLTQVVELKDLRIDIGVAGAAEARELVEVGDPAVLAVEPVSLPHGRVVSRSLDNRVSAYAAARVMQGLAEGGGTPGAVTAVAAVQEETSLAGARVASFAVAPDFAVVIDVTQAADGPGDTQEIAGDARLGSGPVIVRGAHADVRIVRALRETAAELGIPYTLEAAGGATYTDADAVHVSRAGIPTCIVSIPLRYMHSPVEMIQLSDVEQTAELVRGLITRSVASL
ncbi:MAG TPA: M20/M25/M40 family metallo-hydrolase [Solirubrobacteraceae bacterium]|nr:M20/M25/M40 family metallo-hydrolase [Solirubrobacteraceae bacterium]